MLFGHSKLRAPTHHRSNYTSITKYIVASLALHSFNNEHVVKTIIMTPNDPISD